MIHHYHFMDVLKGFFANLRKTTIKEKMGGILGINKNLSDFQKKKLLHEYYTFFDFNRNGRLEQKDFELAREKISEMSGWKKDSKKYKETKELFMEVWRMLSDEGDENNDGIITEEEWLRMWERFNKDSCKQSKTEEDPAKVIPNWLERYVEFKFNLLDRTGDGVIDIDEFEYVLGDFGVSCKEARTAFVIITQNNEKKIDMDYFKELSAEYYRSNDPGALGNFITGKLDFTDE
ncbi:sarcoplasmic calcium-binding proteins I, III, and IV-like isoform X1 [Gigantopelta aegis]|uniref:sarcoplasmic calcium-binding proteins I, III, and IV-like isoform X1 n=2 Tax=Gigantopelta aegis TaxID=1735272 RepID=UPI001B8887DD|nr:sarcoplasmic calcium-binding proteins I, III, and IV-like isoform X1 [Gigantopelta aegis]